jgi:hypothetical protein
LGLLPVDEECHCEGDEDDGGDDEVGEAFVHIYLR